ncbi:MAG TPA: protein kinase [Steroidobacteraceae bacterium]|nr:protein kinase [Steroidobacteraceae bacterium]
MSARILIIDRQRDSGMELAQKVCLALPDAAVVFHTRARVAEDGPALNEFSAVVLSCRRDSDSDGATDEGLAELKALLEQPKCPPVVAIAAGGDSRRAASVIKAGAFDCVAEENLSAATLAASLRQALKRERAERAKARKPRHSEPDPLGIPGYRVIKTIVRSERSAVYRAYSERLRREVALKVLSFGGGEERAREEADRLKREYDIIVTLSHPAIVTIHDFGLTSDSSYIATEYFAHGSLKDRLKKGLTIDDSVAYFKQIANALRALHAAGVLHRDLKPANVMRRSDDSLVLIDFGLARRVESSTVMTAAGEVRGSPYYMSPEQAEGRSLDDRSDLYSLGVMFYEMLAGTKPYNGQNVYQILQSHIHAEIPRLPGDAERFQRVIDRLMAKNPRERYASATAALLAVEAVQSTLADGAPDQARAAASGNS